MLVCGAVRSLIWDDKRGPDIYGAGGEYDHRRGGVAGVDWNYF